jgi:hypothetical protein
MYLFHNVYGDAEGLIANKPEGVQCVPFGWTEEIETTRNELIAQLDCTVSCLPSLVFLVPEKMVVVGVLVDEVLEESLARLPEHYEELRILDMPKPWSWNTVLPIVEDTFIATKPYPADGKVYRWNVEQLNWIEVSV